LKGSSFISLQRSSVCKSRCSCCSSCHLSKDHDDEEETPRTPRVEIPKDL
jgi:hypothetical protein